MRHSLYLIATLFLSFSWCVISCTHPKINNTLDSAESLMETHPDLSLKLLAGINTDSLSGKKQKARYSLLMSMALDKNYIDTTTFDILQPALDYYLRHGTPGEKLRSYYYKGRLLQNNKKYNDALSSFFKGIDIADQCDDSLYLARAFVAQGCIYYALYDINSYVESYLKAADIYNSLCYYDRAFDCIINALSGSIFLGNRFQADSLFNICNNPIYIESGQDKELYNCILGYKIEFCTQDDVKEWIRENSHFVALNPLTLAYAYNKIGENEKALSILETIKNANIL